MKLIVRIILFLLCLSALAYAAFFVFINTAGKDFVVTAIEKQLGARPRLDKLTMDFPFEFHIRNFAFENIYFDRLDASFNLFKTFHDRRVTFENINMAVCNIKIAINEKGINAGVLGCKTDFQKVGFNLPDFDLIPQAFAANKEIMPFAVNNFNLERGTIEVTPKTNGQNAVYRLRDISLELKDIVYPDLNKFSIKFLSSFESGKTFLPDLFKVDGWVDLPAREMDLSARVKGLDYCLLGRYLPNGWQPAQLGLKEAFLNLDIAAKARENDLNVYCTVVADKYEFVSSEDAQDLSRMKTLKTILAVLAGPDGKPTYTFHFSTKMDSPQFDFKVIQEDLKNAINLPILFVDNLLNTAVKALVKSPQTATNLTGDTVNTAIDIFKEIYGQVKGKHKKKHQEDAAQTLNASNAVEAVNAPMPANAQETANAPVAANVSAPANVSMPANEVPAAVMPAPESANAPPDLPVDSNLTR